MSTGYTRQSAAEIIPSAVVKSSSFNNELNKVRDAFKFSTDGSTGHTHDGSSDEGSYIPLIADVDANNKVVVDGSTNRISFYNEVSSSPVEQVRFEDGVIKPVTDNDVDLGTSTLEFKNLYLDGTAKVDTLTVDENADVTGTLTVTGVTTLSDTLDVTGASTLTSLTTSGDATVGGTLGVTGATTFGSNVSLGGNRVTSVAAPTGSGDAVNLQYLTDTITGSSPTLRPITWQSAGDYSTGDTVFSPVNYLVYESLTDHTGVTTDPSLDETNWVLVTSLANSFPWVVKTATYTALDQDKILADTSGGGFTVTLPASPATGSEVWFADSGSNWASNNLTVSGNGNNIDGSATFAADVNEGHFITVYNGSSWVVRFTGGTV